MSNPVLNAQRVRIKLDNAATDGSKVQGTGASPKSWKGFDVQFELAAFLINNLQDLSRLSSVTLEVKPDVESAAVITKTILAAGLNNALTQDQWDDATSQHIVIPITAAEANVDVKDYRVIVYAVTIDSPARNVALGWFTWTLADFGARVAGTPPVVAGPWYTQTESDARFAPANGAQARWRWSGTCWQLWFDTEGKWHDIVGVVVDGKLTFDFGPAVD